MHIIPCDLRDEKETNYPWVCFIYNFYVQYIYEQKLMYQTSKIFYELFVLTECVLINLDYDTSCCKFFMPNLQN